MGIRFSSPITRVSSTRIADPFSPNSNGHVVRRLRTLIAPAPVVATPTLFTNQCERVGASVTELAPAHQAALARAA